MDRKKVVLYNDNVSIGLARITEFLNEISNFLQFEEADFHVNIQSNLVNTDTFNNISLVVPDDVLFSIVFTDKKYHNNYFYEIHDRLVIASTYAWEYLTELSKNNGVTFFIAEVLSELIDPDFRHTVDCGSRPECVFDFLEDKAGIDTALRSALVCAQCHERIQTYINDETKRYLYDDFRSILDLVGSASKWNDDIVAYWAKRSKEVVSHEIRNSLFISYAHSDMEWLELVKKFLKPIERKAIIEVWDDSCIRIGQKWKEEISTALMNSTAAILLVSQDFLASDFVHEEELPKILHGAKANGTKVYLLLVSPSTIESTELAKFQAVNSPKKTLTELDRGERDRCLLKLHEAILQDFE